MDEQYDLVVIGGGPGGYGAALYATSAGLRVAVVEKDTMGGTCLNRGCIPAKAFLETAAVNRHVAHAADCAPGALAARISGDRFAVLLPIGLDDAGTFAESLRQGAEQLGNSIGGGLRLV